MTLRLSHSLGDTVIKAGFMGLLAATEGNWQKSGKKMTLHSTLG
ncbi:hypothetical protein QCN27_17430 [Cereibacter sp. SYSU M97828]|nr:hypothetical protein [Cereibacter flavus]